MKTFVGIIFLAFSPFVGAGFDTTASSLRRGDPANDFDEAGNCISDACQAADLAFVESIQAARRNANDTTNHTSRLLIPMASASFFEGSSSLFQSCLDVDIYVQAVASSSGNWGRPAEAWLLSVTKNGRYPSNELFCHDNDSRLSWFPCPPDVNGDTTDGENYHYIDAGHGVVTGAWFKLEWSEPQCLCRIWIDTKGFIKWYPCGQDTM
jgi:hypothetical protein